MRQHIARLAEAGITWQEVVRISGVRYWVVHSLLFGCRPGRGPTRRIRRGNAERILAVRHAFPAEPRPKALADSAGTRRRLQALMACGWYQAALAAELDLAPQDVAQFLVRASVQEVTRDRVRVLYDRLWNAPAPAGTPRQREASRRVREQAARMGWPPPAAWDDDTIDDPAAMPADGWKRSARPARVPGAEKAAEARLLMSRGRSYADVAQAFGLGEKSLERLLLRHPEIAA